VVKRLSIDENGQVRLPAEALRAIGVKAPQYVLLSVCGEQVVITRAQIQPLEPASSE